MPELRRGSLPLIPLPTDPRLLQHLMALSSQKQHGTALDSAEGAAHSDGTADEFSVDPAVKTGFYIEQVPLTPRSAQLLALEKETLTSHLESVWVWLLRLHTNLIFLFSSTNLVCFLCLRLLFFCEFIVSFYACM